MFVVERCCADSVVDTSLEIGDFFERLESESRNRCSGVSGEFAYEVGEEFILHRVVLLVQVSNNYCLRGDTRLDKC